MLVDTCNHALPFWQLLYARKWYQAELGRLFFDVERNPDSTAFGWPHVKPSYESVRDSMKSIEDDLGPFYFHRVWPEIDDSNDLKSRVFMVRFERLVNADSAAGRFMRAIPEIFLMGLASRPLEPATADNAPSGRATSVAIVPNMSSGPVIVEITTRYQRRSMRVALVTLRGEIVREWTDVIAGNDGRGRLPLNLSDLPAGRYLVRVDDAYCQIIIPGGR